MTILRDPNTGDAGRITATGRLRTLSTTADLQTEGAVTGDTYNFNTGLFTLTSANTTALAYLKNNGDRPVQVNAIGVQVGNSTGGSGDCVITVSKNPTGGTIISTASPVDILVNKNFGSNKNLSVDAYKGFEGATYTGGEDAYYTLRSGAPFLNTITTGAVVLEKGASLVVSFTPPAGNTDLQVLCFLALLDDTFQ